jgi:hypothetical protein
LSKKNSTQNRWWTIFVSRESKERNIYVNDDGRSRVGYSYIFISDYKNASLLPFKFGKISFNLHRCRYFKINIQIGIKPTYCSHYTQVLYKFLLCTSTIVINDKNVIIKFSAHARLWNKLHQVLYIKYKMWYWTLSMLTEN